jgi:exonuclease SbcC
MDSIKTQGRIFHEQWDTAKEKVAAVKELGSQEDLERQLMLLKKAKAQAEADVENTTERINEFRAEHEKQKGLAEKGEKEERILQARLENSLKESGFSSVDEAKSLLEKIGDAEREKSVCTRFFDGYALAKGKYEETDKGKFVAFDENALSNARACKTEKKLARDTLSQRLADYNAEYKILLEKREKYRAFEAELKEKEKQKNLCEELHKLLKGNKFLEFIASEYLQEICIRASKILLSLTAGRYFLRYDKEFKVGDNLEGGSFRAARTLSGGETFLVSLSLALSLSGEICLRSRRSMEFFFLDEGFGTLDDKLVDTVMNVLTKLSKEFAVGLISHVAELKHRIENKIVVTGANEQHGSQVKVENF